MQYVLSAESVALLRSLLVFADPPQYELRVYRLGLRVLRLGLQRVVCRHRAASPPTVQMAGPDRPWPWPQAGLILLLPVDADPPRCAFELCPHGPFDIAARHPTCGSIPIRRCHGCGLVYCSAACHAWHWPAHAQDCCRGGCVVLGPVEASRLVQAANTGSVVVPACTTHIGENAFSSRRVAAVALPDGLLAVGDYAFASCGRLSGPELPGAVRWIGEGAYRGCESLSPRLSIAAAVIGQEAFADSSLQSLTFARSVVGVGVRAFGGCRRLQTVRFGHGSSVTVLPEGVFCDCRLLTRVVLPAGLRRLGDRAFQSCCALGRVRLPGGLLVLPRLVFVGCVSLQEVLLPHGLRVIGEGAFAGCSALVTVAPPTIGPPFPCGAQTEVRALLLCMCREAGPIQAAMSALARRTASFLDGPFPRSAPSEVSLPAGTTIGTGAFTGCSGLGHQRLAELEARYEHVDEPRLSRGF